jgi:hypothetical protein
MVDLVVGAPLDDDGVHRAGAVYVVILETNGIVKNAQKISMLHANFNAFYSLGDTNFFGMPVAMLDDLDANAVVDLAVGAIDDHAGGKWVGAVFILFLDQNATSVKNAQKISMLYGNFNLFYSLSSTDNSNLGSAVRVLGDISGDGVEDLAVGAYTADDGAFSAGEVFILFL